MTQRCCRHNQRGNWRQRAQDFFYSMSQLDEFFSLKIDDRAMCIWFVVPCLPVTFFGMQVSLTHSLILAFRWATNSFTKLCTIIHLPPLVGIPFMCTRGRRIIPDAIFAAKRNLPTNNFLIHDVTLKICCAFSNFHFLHQFMPIIVHQGCPSNN